MFFHDLLDDREPKASPLLSGCHIRLGNPFAVLRQADSVIGDGHHNVFRPPHQGDSDFAAIIRLIAFLAGFNCLYGIFENIGHGLTELVPVAGNDPHLWISREREIDVRAGHFLQEQRLPR